MSDVVLTSALRTNLLSLQNTQSLIDKTQLRLANGLKVNSALDNPQSYFAAQSLNNRASDLTRLLDGIGQSISTIKAANEGITSLTTLIEQADSLATSALEATSSASQSTAITGDVDLTDFTITAANAGTLLLDFSNQDGEDITLSSTASEDRSITLAAGDTIDTIINNINAVRDSNGDKVINAALNSAGRLEIKTLNGASARIELVSTGTATLVGSQTLSAVLGLSSVLKAESALTPAGTASTSVHTNIDASATISSQALYKSDGTTLAQRSTLLDDLLRDANGDGTVSDAVMTFSGDAGADTYFVNIGINGGPAAAIGVTAATSTVQELVDNINNNATLTSRITASFDETTGQITFAPKDGTVESIEFSLSATESADTDARLQGSFGFGSARLADALDTTVAGAAGTEYSNVESIRFGSGGGEIAQYETDFNKLLDQIDSLVTDSGYRGTNLLTGDNLVTTFNEDRTNTLTTEGSDFTSSGMGISAASFATRSNITTTLDQVRAALTTVRDFGGSISNDLTIIQTREDFTKKMISNLQEGRDKLVVADQNEEGANLLSLQTRQTLGVTSLSLASQSQQSVLRLF